MTIPAARAVALEKEGAPAQKRAVALVSGGLDSMLAACLVARQGVAVTCLCCESLFFGAGKARQMAAAAGLPLVVEDFSDDHWAMVQHPGRGYGKQMNPCIDCHLLMLRRARRWLDAGRADFVVTGEVVGQRPMSQNQPTLRYLEKQANLEGLLLRPLSARLLPETLPEKNGWLDRARLLDISGRARGRQAALAAELGITDYPQPAGGCLLTMAEFSRRLRDAIAHQEIDRAWVTLLRYGRHFRLPSGGKIIVGRNDRENTALLAQAPAAAWVLTTDPLPGPVALATRAEDVPAAAALVARYATSIRRTRGEGVPVPVTVWHGDTAQAVTAQPLDDAVAAPWRL